MVRHQVKLGETVKMLSKKYHVPPADIYRLNKFAVEGIREGMVLQIPAERKYAEAALKDEGILPQPPETATPANMGRNTGRSKSPQGEAVSDVAED